MQAHGFDPGDEPRLVELERRKLGQDLLIEARGGFLAGFAQGRGRACIGVTRGFRCGGQFVEPRFALLERGKLGFEAGDKGRQIVNADPVLAGKRAEREQPLLGAFELMRLEGGGGERLLDLGARGVGLGEHALKRLGHGGEQRAARPRLALDPAERRGEPRPARPLALQRVESLVQLARDLLGVHHQLPPRGERLLLAGLRIEAHKLVQRMADIVGIGADRGDFGGMPRPLILGGAPRLPGGRHRFRLAAQAAKGIDEVAVAARVDQRPVVVLAVDLDERPAHLAQELHANGDVVDEGAGAAVGGLDAAQDQRRIGLQAVIGKEPQHGMIGGEIESRGHLALAGALPHQRGIAAAADGKGEGIEQDRLAGAGLAGEHAKARAEFEIEPVDQNDVADRQGG